MLIVDDQHEIHDDFREMLAPAGTGSRADELAAAFLPEADRAFLPDFELLHAASGEQGYEIVRRARDMRRPVAVAYVDIRMPPGMDGVETIRRIRAIDRHIELVIMTAYTDKPLPEIVHDMERLHKLLYIRKPFAREEIQQITLSLVGKWNVERELRKNRRQLVGSHRRLEAVLDATGDAMAMYDAGGRLLFANHWYEELTGVTTDDLKRMAPDALSTMFRERFREPDLREAEGRFLLDDGGDGNVVEPVSSGSSQVPKQRLFYRSTASVRDGRGETIGDLYVYRDVSREIEMEQMKAEVIRLRSELQTTYSFAGMIGSSGTMQQVYRLMKRAVDGDITVLIRGESGTGKELVAKSLHFNGPRKGGPFLAVNCAAVPETLIESELFGHEAGAFTGAAARRIGTFERAGGGTILLDEIGDMQPVLQAKLLRVLQEREIQRLGGTSTIAVDVRVIAATNKNLEAAVRAGEFREDLFYRVAAFPIVVPPLRERRDDIPLLAKHFLEKHAAANGKSLRGISTGALRLLLRHDWPGNVRELDNAIGRAVLLETTDVLQAPNLPPHLAPVASGGRPSDGDPGAQGDGPAEVRPLVDVERETLAQALAASAHNVTRAALALGVSRATLYRKLKRHGLSAQAGRGTVPK